MSEKTIDKVKATCPCGSVFEVEAAYPNYTYDPWLKAHAKCLEQNTLQTVKPVKYPNVGPPQVRYGDPFSFTTIGSGLHYQ